MSGSIITTLAQERRSQPQQILDLQAQYSDLRQRAALDSQALHTARMEHEAALVHFKQEHDALVTQVADDSERLWAVFNQHEGQLLAWQGLTFWQRLRWLIRG